MKLTIITFVSFEIWKLNSTIIFLLPGNGEGHEEKGYVVHSLVNYHATSDIEINELSLQMGEVFSVTQTTAQTNNPLQVFLSGAGHKHLEIAPLL